MGHQLLHSNNDVLKYRGDQKVALDISVKERVYPPDFGGMFSHGVLKHREQANLVLSMHSRQGENSVFLYSYVFLVFLYSCIPVFLRISSYSLVFLGIPMYSYVFLRIPTYSDVFRRIPTHVCMHIVECRSLRYRLKVKGEGSRTKSQKLTMIFFDFSHVFLCIPLYSSVFLCIPRYS